MTRQQALYLIQVERFRQLAKFGVQSHPDLKWLAILGEEFGEVCKDIVEDKSATYQEVLQCAAVCVAWLEDKGK